MWLSLVAKPFKFAYATRPKSFTLPAKITGGRRYIYIYVLQLKL